MKKSADTIQKSIRLSEEYLQLLDALESQKKEDEAIFRPKRRNEEIAVYPLW